MYGYRWGDGDLEVAEEEKDVGVMITANLKPSVQCARAAKKANAVLGQLARGVSYRDKSTFLRLFQVFVLPHLSYSVPAWFPHYKADIEILEKVQMRAVMMITNLTGTYEERLSKLGMRTLQDRRLRGDMIETYKILTGKCDVDPHTWFTLNSETPSIIGTRSQSSYLHLRHPPAPNSELCNNFFSHRVVSYWNQLPDHVKMVESTNNFKNAYDNWTGFTKPRC